MHEEHWGPNQTQAGTGNGTGDRKRPPTGASQVPPLSPLMCPQRCLSPNHLRPPSSLPPPPHFVCVLGSSCPQTRLRTPLCVSSGCWLSNNKHLNTLMCVSPALAAQNPRTPVFFIFYFCKPPPCTALSHPAVCVFCVSERVCVLKHTHLTVHGHFVFLSVFVCLLQCSKKKKLALLGSVLPSRVKKKKEKRDGVALCLSFRASLLPFIVVVLLFVAVCCQGFPLLFACR